ncbi:hypothetical protein P153DRAFT_365286 [Dothidotthia symphoricarpi CBS 119687]|uniref:Mitochondrial carrier protein pet8 n=1 Tax=Dothidotthia symphoricarpi CBS 119687 TaxID=1392245 RepID=A0A6A6AKV1_9PLEO|nr:uncharacterized protein P153DRAFT_365286 [Dothidotthia symphoricarpi CBS 119687]KAF2131715.1 hypothetical protein P153DRAFT_365286 [Dothidotthia symphoricarpi CBS 119687]
MSAIRSLATRRAPFVSYGIAQRAAFHQSTTRSAGKESTLHSEGRSDEVHELKQDQLKKQKDGKGHWEEGLASDSESIVKADRNDTNMSSDQHIKKLQEETAKVASKK